MVANGPLPTAGSFPSEIRIEGVTIAIITEASTVKNNDVPRMIPRYGACKNEIPNPRRTARTTEIRREAVISRKK